MQNQKEKNFDKKTETGNLKRKFDSEMEAGGWFRYVGGEVDDERRWTALASKSGPYHGLIIGIGFNFEGWSTRILALYTPCIYSWTRFHSIFNVLFALVLLGARFLNPKPYMIQ